MDETPEAKGNETAPVPLSLPRRLLRWGADHPATVFWLSLGGGVLTTYGLAFLRLPDVLGVLILLTLAAIALVSYVYGVVGVFRRGRRPASTCILQGLALLALPALLVLIVLPNFMAAGRKSKAARTASDTKTAVTQAIVFANDKNVYPTSLKALRDSGYANVLETDPWKAEYVLSPVLTRGSTPQQSDDIYIYSKGPCGTGTYEPTRWRKDPGGYLDTGKCGAVGYSSVYGPFIGEGP